jgi:secernin
MCDTVIATPNVTADGVMIFGKNSDRDPNEAHELVRVPAAKHPAAGRVKCTYIDIPQVEQTLAVLLAKPFWIWGAEMGVNERGVAIGNEAVFSKIPARKEGGLIGMDFLRLALERSTTAIQAVDVITKLLEAYGQGGNCGFTHPFYYDNSFLIADAREAWVLETADKQWAAKRVQGVYTISNGYTIGKEWDLASAGLVDYALERGWCKRRVDFNFRKCYTDFLYTTFSYGKQRCSRTTTLLEGEKGKISVESVINTLRDHGENQGRGWSPDRGLSGASVCMHAGFGPIRISQTTGSMVSHLHSEHPTHFFTATAAPCTSVFKPVWVDVPLPETGARPTGEYDAAAIFWSHEALHRATLRNYPAAMALYQEKRDHLEGGFIRQALELAGASSSEREKFSQMCFSDAVRAEAQWRNDVQASPHKRNPAWLFARAWKNHNRLAKMPDD